MKTLLIAESAVVGTAGLALLLIPSAAASVMFSSSLGDPVGSFVCRGAGATLFTLGLVCWLWRKTGERRATTGLIGAMFLYDTAVVVVLLSARSTVGLSGVGLWPAIVIHLGLGIWCLVDLFRVPGLSRLA